jgi:hypothetical protein
VPGVARVDIYYDGCGDSGQIEDIRYFDHLQQRRLNVPTRYIAGEHIKKGLRRHRTVGLGLVVAHPAGGLDESPLRLCGSGTPGRRSVARRLWHIGR